MSIMQHIPEEHWNWSSIDQCWIQAVYFLIERHGFHTFKDITKYSALRLALRQKLAMDHRGFVTTAEKLPQEVVSSIKNKEVESMALIKTITDEHGGTLSDWLQENDMELPTETLPCYTMFLMACKKTAKATQQMNTASMVKVRSSMHQNTRTHSELALEGPVP